ncbi:MAG: RNA methyltransferase [Sphingobacteriales bacterium]|nr:MAG: RNA methyltransferase [Sphingobacteriales bacterium]
MTPERRSRITSVLNHRQPDLTVIMENVQDPHNIAAVMRTCDAVGIQEIFVLNTTIGKYDYFGIRSSSTASKWVTVRQYDNVDECMKAVKERYYKVYATHLGESAKSMYELDMAQPVALLFGNERKGVSEEALKHCDGNFIIPQVGMIKSLNISVACAVTLYEAFRQRQQIGYYNGTARLPQEQWNTLSESWGMTPEESAAETNE